jgi:hypothetical protein
VVSMSSSLRNEFQRRGIPSEPNPGLTLGIAFAILGVITVVPSAFLRVLAVIGTIVFWVLYWVKIGDLTARLATAPPAPAPTA